MTTTTKTLGIKSTKGSLSTYDWYGSLRGVGLFVLAGLATNIGIIETLLNDLGISSFFVTLILWGIVDLARRFIRDYSRE